MKRRMHIETYHPSVPLVYFLGMAVITVANPHPVLTAVSLLGAVLSTGMLIGMRKLLASLGYSLPLLLMIAAVNPMFVHRGETMLFFLNDNPVTLEAVYYGLTAAAMLIAVFYWFKCYSIVMTSDKFIYLFGRAAPRLSLVLSMTLAFVSKFKRQYKRINAVQKSMGMYASNSFSDRVISRMRTLSALVGWALESSVEIADSMNARGYGLKGRTSFALYRFTVRDGFALIFLAAAFVAFTVGSSLAPAFSFYPAMSPVSTSAAAIVGYTSLFLAAVCAAAAEIRENIRWKLLISRV